MGYVLELSNISGGFLDWTDISNKSKFLNPEMRLDIFDTRFIEYNGKSMELEAEGLNLQERDFLRFRTDASPVNYENIMYDIDAEMYQSTGHNWADSGATISFDIDTTVTGKMYIQTTASTADYMYITKIQRLAKYKVYRVKFKARLNSGSGRTWRFGQINGTPIAANYYEVTIDQATETQYEGTFTTSDDCDGIFRFGCTSTGGADAVEIDDVELYVESYDVLFSGYIKNVVKNVKRNTYTFDVENEIAELKDRDIEAVITGSVMRDRLYDQLPDDYAIVEINSTVRSRWANETRANGMTYVNDEVVGSDLSNYACKVNHVSSTSDTPTTGANYADYWQLRSLSGETWIQNKEYKVGDLVQGTDTNTYECIDDHKSKSHNQPITGSKYTDFWLQRTAAPAWQNNYEYDAMKFTDLLFDIMLVFNSYHTHREDLFYCVVVDKEIRIYTVDIGGTPTAIADADMEEIEATIKETYVYAVYEDLLAPDYRGQNYTDGGSYLFRAKWIVRKHKFFTVAEHPIMTLVSNSGYSGIITGIEKRGAMFEYEVTEIEEDI